MLERTADSSPQSKCSIHMQPRAFFMCGSHNLLDGIESAGVHVASLGTNNGGAGAFLQSFHQFGGNHSALAICGNIDYVACTQAKHTQRCMNGDMRLIAKDDVNFGRTI